MRRNLASSFAISGSLLWAAWFGLGLVNSVEAELPGQSAEPTASHSESRMGSIASCFASSCHGSRAIDAPPWQKAGQTWFDFDPHARAYTDLLRPASLAIAEKLLHRSLPSVDDRDYLQFLEQRCVSCHASPHSADDQRLLGADCQVCHGPAKAWDDRHYSSPWRELKGRRFEGTEMLNTEALASRAQICMSCHVGDLKSTDGTREVDHDLMAAGHPPMHFEFEAFLRAYPAHWDRDQDVKLFGESVGQQRWRLGQLVHTQTRLRLLIERARSIESQAAVGRAWPELTEYSCYSCHHSLVQPSWRPTPGADALYDWDAWCLTGLRYAVPAADQPELDRRIASLKLATESRQPQASKVQAAAGELLTLVDQLLLSPKSNAALATDQVASALRLLLQEKSDGKSWEAGAQWYCAVAAHLESISPADGSTAVRDGSAAEQIRQGALNPVNYHPMNLDSERGQFEKLLRKARP